MGYFYNNGYLNSRYKDFYDIYVLTRKYSFRYDDMRNAVIETFGNRGTNLSTDTAAFRAEFVQDSMHQTRWKSFLKKKKALVPITIEDALSGVKTFAKPLLEGDSDGRNKWNPEKGSWE